MKDQLARYHKLLRTTSTLINNAINELEATDKELLNPYHWNFWTIVDNIKTIARWRGWKIDMRFGRLTVKNSHYVLVAEIPESTMDQVKRITLFQLRDILQKITLEERA